MMSEFTKPIEDLGKNTADYVEARIDDLKLRTAKGLSLTLGKLLYMLLVPFYRVRHSDRACHRRSDVDRGVDRKLCGGGRDSGRCLRGDSCGCRLAEKEAVPQHFRADVHQTVL